MLELLVKLKDRGRDEHERLRGLLSCGLGSLRALERADVVANSSIH